PLRPTTREGETAMTTNYGCQVDGRQAGALADSPARPSPKGARENTNGALAAAPAARATNGSAAPKPPSDRAAADDAERAIETARSVGNRLRDGLRSVIFGQEEVIAGV